MENWSSKPQKHNPPLIVNKVRVHGGAHKFIGRSLKKRLVSLCMGSRIFLQFTAWHHTWESWYELKHTKCKENLKTGALILVYSCTWIFSYFNRLFCTKLYTYSCHSYRFVFRPCQIIIPRTGQNFGGNIVRGTNFVEVRSSGPKFPWQASLAFHLHYTSPRSFRGRHWVPVDPRILIRPRFWIK